MFLPIRRATFLIPSGPPEDPCREHLFVVLTDPFFFYEESRVKEVLLVSFSSWRPNGDDACILEPGDHPFLKRKSFVDYKRARIEEAGRLSEFEQREPVGGEVFQKICQGLELSERTRSKVLAFYRKASDG